LTRNRSAHQKRIPRWKRRRTHLRFGFLYFVRAEALHPFFLKTFVVPKNFNQQLDIICAE
jgi:hypothetical protein